MNTKEIEYIIAIAENDGIANASKVLFVTPSALSQQLNKIETDVGAKLFRRNKSGWHITPEGCVYLENAYEIMQIKKRTYDIIADMVQKKNITISVGITPGRSQDMLAYVYPKFHSIYPQCIVQPMELSVIKQQERIHKGTLTVGLVTLLDSQKDNDEYIDLYSEEIMLAVPHGMKLPDVSAPVDPKDHFPTVSIRSLTGQPFILLYKESTIRALIDPIFQKASLTPKVLFETSSTETILGLIRGQMCCSFIPYYYVKDKPDGIDFYHLPSRPSWKVCAAYHKGGYLSRASRTFVQLAKEYWMRPDG